MTKDNKEMFEQAKLNASPRVIELINGIEKNVKRWQACSEEILLTDIDYIAGLTNKEYQWLNNELIELARDIHESRFGKLCG